MSLLNTIRVKLGLSNTPANNFVLDASADNGTMKLARGNPGATTQDILTVDADGKAVFSQNAQTWQDMISSREVNGTQYVNTTKLPIKVSVKVVGDSLAALSLGITVSGIVVAAPQTYAPSPGYSVSAFFEVPAGGTYSVLASTNAGTITKNLWVELR